MLRTRRQKEHTTKTVVTKTRLAFLQEASRKANRVHIPELSRTFSNQTKENISSQEKLLFLVPIPSKDLTHLLTPLHCVRANMKVLKCVRWLRVKVPELRHKGRTQSDARVN